MKKIFITAMIVISLLMIVSAHKDASVTSSSVASYDIRMGLNPVHPFENNDQKMFFEVTDKNGLVSGLEAEFEILEDELNIAKVKAEEVSEGKYVASYKLEKGNYEIKGKLYEKNSLLTEVSRNISVEPNSPSTLFWIYMLIMVIIGAIIASQSHKF